jgi:hypothetical protein
MPYHHRQNRSHRGTDHLRDEPLSEKTTSIPRDRLIQVPKHMSGALRYQADDSLLARQMA